MSRMDRYNNLETDNVEKNIEKKLSRLEKNKKMYDEIYLNNSFVNLNEVMNEKEDIKQLEENITYEPETYEKKSYDVKDYIEKPHEKQIDDNAMRNLDDKSFREQENEISKLVASIDEKIEEENDSFDFLNDLRGENSDTMVEGQLKTDEFNSSIYATLAEEEIFDNHNDLTKLDKALSDETVLKLAQVEDDKIDHTFEKIIEMDNRIARKSKKLPIIVFCITLFILIVVIILIFVFK